MNQILVEGGFAPEWIMLKRDIIDQQHHLRKHLQSKCQELLANKVSLTASTKLGDRGKMHDTSKNPKQEWNKYCELVEQENDTLKLLNKNIDKFNLIVPMMKGQMFHFNLKKEAETIYSLCAKTVEQGVEKDSTNDSNTITNNNINENLMDTFSYFKGSHILFNVVINQIIATLNGKSKTDP